MVQLLTQKADDHLHHVLLERTGSTNLKNPSTFAATLKKTGFIFKGFNKIFCKPSSPKNNSQSSWFYGSGFFGELLSIV